MSILAKYAARARQVNSLVCVGLDSHLDWLPTIFRQHPTPQFAFNRQIIDATHPYVSAYKPNIAFYEARGAQGWHELKLTLDYLRAAYPDIVTIGDAKRADIGSTNDAYIRALFDDLGFDAVTLHPYLGREALQPFLNRADKACIILCRTSNPGAGEFQDLLVAGKPLWQVVAERVAQTWNEHKNCMLVVGATYPQEMAQIRQAVGDDMTFLVPGIGAQGGDVAQVIPAGINTRGLGLIINSARGILLADQPAPAAQTLRDSINHYRGGTL
jgi:orotidine-5'-phosphate decarboxylase